MSAPISISHFFSCHKYLVLLLLLVLFHLSLSEQTYDDVLCIDGEREALMEFKNGLIDEVDRLVSWVGEKSDCCRWTGIVCDNNTGHVEEIRLRGLDGHCDAIYWASGGSNSKDELKRQRLKGYLSPSLLELKKLKHLDLSCNDFTETGQIPSFIGSLRNLRYLNLSESLFRGVIPPQKGNLLELRVLSLGSYPIYPIQSTPSVLWLSNLRFLNHLDMSFVDLSEAIDWFQVINTIPSLIQLHLPWCQLSNSHPYITKLSNLTSLSVLDISSNEFEKQIVPQWIFSLTTLVSLDLSYCQFVSLVPNSSYSFHNLTSLESLHDLTSLRSLDISYNQLTKPIPDSLCNFCNLRELYLSGNNFTNIALQSLLNSLFNCKSPSLETLVVDSSGLSGPIPYSIGRFSSLKELKVDHNRLNGSLPNSIGLLSSLERLYLNENQFIGSLPVCLGQLAKLEWLWFSNNLLTEIVTEVHFAKLVSLKSLFGDGNNLTLHVAIDWIPPFHVLDLRLNSWRLGPEFPLWIQSQRDLETLDISNTSISSRMPPESFWRSFPCNTPGMTSHIPMCCGEPIESTAEVLLY